MDDLIEFVLELLFDIGNEVGEKNKTVRIIITIISLLIGFFILGLGLFLLKESLLGGMLLALIGLFFIISIIYKFIKNKDGNKVEKSEE